MKHWQETSELLAHLEELHESGQRAAIACVVQIAGSAYRRPGARFLIAEDGSTRGGISGGCLEEDVRRHGLEVIESGTSRLLHYETGDDEDSLWGLGLGCDGQVDVLVVPTDAAEFQESCETMRRLLAGDERFAAITTLGNASAAKTTQAAEAARAPRTTRAERAAGAPRAARAAQPASAPTPVAEVPDGGRMLLPGPPEADGEGATLSANHAFAAAAAESLAAGTSSLTEADGQRAFIEVFNPPSLLIVCGASDDARPLVSTAASVGFRVLVVDHRPAYLTERRFPSAWRLIRALPEDEVEDLPTTPNTYVVLKTHNLVRDKAWARRFLATPVPYLGLLGPRARCEEIIAESAEADRPRIFGPVGLDIGAEGAEQVGLCVVSELLAVRSERLPQHLRDRKAAIHV